MKHQISSYSLRLQEHIYKKRWLFLASIIISILCAVLGGAEFGLFIWVFLIFLFGGYSSKPLVIVGLGILIFVPILLSGRDTQLAQRFAIYSYYLLISATALELFHIIKKHQKSHKIFHLDSLSRPFKRFIHPITSSPLDSLSRPSERFEISTTAPITATNFKTTISNLQNTTVFKFIIHNWNLVVGILHIIIASSIFRFSGLPYFRDLMVLPFYHNIQSTDLDFVEQIIFNKMSEIFPANIVSSLFFIIIFSGGGYLTYLFLVKIQQLFSEQISYIFSLPNSVFVFVFSLLVVYNPFILERFLMGQYTVIRGHVLFIPVLYFIIRFLEIFWNKSFHIHTFFSEKNITTSIQFCWAISILTLLSIHHAIFAFVILFAGLVGIAISRRKKITSLLSKKNVFQTLNDFSKISITFLLLLVPSMAIIILRTLSGSQKATFDSFSKSQPTYLETIVRSFSLQVNEGENLILRALIGSGSWNTPSFSEIQNIVSDLGILSHLTLYNNSFLVVLTIGFFVGLSFLSLQKIDSYSNRTLSSFFFVLPVVLILNFGFSGSFGFINRWFFSLPFSLILRESGKWYSLFFVLLTLLIVIYHEKLSKRIKYAALCGMALLTLSNLIMFFPLSNHISYASYPELLKEVALTCKRGESNKVLFLPFSTYIYPSDSGIFSANYSSQILPCTVIKPDFASLIDPENPEKSVVLSANSSSISLNSAIQDFIELEKQQSPDGQIIDPFVNFKKEMKRLGVSTIIVDDYFYDGSNENEPNLELFVIKLSQRISPAIQEKGDQKSVSLFYLN